jgi:hypothetical protein
MAGIAKWPFVLQLAGALAWVTFSREAGCDIVTSHERVGRLPSVGTAGCFCTPLVAGWVWGSSLSLPVGAAYRGLGVGSSLFSSCSFSFFSKPMVSTAGRHRINHWDLNSNSNFSNYIIVRHLLNITESYFSPQ